MKMINLNLIKDKNLISVAEKVLSKEFVTESDAHNMLKSTDIIGLGSIANFVREEMHGNNAFYGVNMNLNYTNICELRCPICAFSKDKDEEGAYQYSIEEIEERIKAAVKFGIDEVHIVGGLNPELKIEYFEEMLQRIKAIKKNLFIVAFTATEYDYFSKINNIPIEDVFTRMIDAGLGALPGGGAEVFDPVKRNIITPKKISGKRWLEIMKIAHGFGLKTNATMLYGHIEDQSDIINHMSQLRDLQNETNGFKTFVPLPYHDSKTELKVDRPVTTGFDDIRIYSTARIFLNNIPHVKGLWMYLGEKMAQVLLNFGVDDIGATYHYEKVVHSAGATTPDFGTEDYLKKLITDSGRKPVRTTAGYNF